MQLVAGVDALWAVTGKKMLIECQARDLLQDWNAVLFSGTGIDCRLINDDIPDLEHSPDRVRSFDQVREVGTFLCVDRRWNSDNVHVAVGKVSQLASETQALCGTNLLVGHFERRVLTRLQRFNA